MSSANVDSGKTNDEVQSVTVDERSVTVDGAIALAGEYGRFQIVVNAMFCLMTFPAVFHVMLPYFAADNVDWKCSLNSTVCNIKTRSFSYENTTRCDTTRFSRHDWEYVTPRDYSVVTTFDLVCGMRLIRESVVLIFFIGWLIGSIVLGWFSDNYGRKIVIFVSLTVIMVTGFITPFLPHIYAYIFCRFVVGFFIPGTFQLMIMIMTEIVGPSYRAFAGNIIFVFATSGMALLGLKAYYIRQWKMLYIACTVPYFFVLLFYWFIPKSIRGLAIKGKTRELMRTLQRMAKLNNRELPSKFVVITESSVITSHHSNPLDLFRSKKLAKKTLCQILAYLVGGMTFYGLYIAAKELGHHKYRDFVTVTLCEIPVALSAIALCERFGRKKTVMFFYGIGTLSCIGLIFAPKEGSASILRTLFGTLGKCCIGPGYNILQSWTMELYPTYIRGEAMGVLQAVTRLGAAFAPVVDTELSSTQAFVFFACLTFASMCLLPPLKEMKGQDMGETEVEEVERNFEIMQEVEMENKVEMNGHTNAYSNELYDKMHGEENAVNNTEESDKSRTNSAVIDLSKKVQFDAQESVEQEMTVI